MPGANWHRDTTWVVDEGSGTGTVVDPRGMDWSASGGTALYAADFGKNWVQKLSDRNSSTGFYFLDGGLSGTPFNGPTDVVVDTDGFLYICDNGNQRVLRYGGDQTFTQVVNVEKDADGQTLSDPVAVAADDSLVYVADRGSGKVIRYQRRK
jgi:sugar lactone lactonase YvrE